MSYRIFTLTNSQGNTWTFTNENSKVFLNDPTGLGIENSLGVTRYGEKANVVTEEFTLPTVGGEILFYDSSNSDRYQKYYNFLRFISYTPLTLSYTIPLSTPATYTLNCYVTSISKTESKKDGMMTCSVQFQGLGFWRSSQTTVTGSTDTYTLTNNGDFPVGFEITIDGSLENPYFTLVQDSELYGEAKFDDSTAFDEIYVNSQDGEQEVILSQSGSVLANPLGYQDLSISNGSIYVTFVKLARGTSTLTIGYDTGTITSVEIKYYQEYRSV